MELKMYQADAFCNKQFGGNPAAVCLLQEWLSDGLMQNIAMENNLAETAFIVKQNQHYEIRWFTPAVEVDLCGHATLASAFVLFEHEKHSGEAIYFHSPRSGELTVTKAGEYLSMNFPADEIEEIEVSSEMVNCFNNAPKRALKGKTDFVFIYHTEEEIRNLKPHLQNISKLDCRGLIVTAKGDQEDFVSRFFAPQSGINEDPVTGSAHTTLTPYWATTLGKKELTARQLSEREGFLQCRHLNERVEISGQCVLYSISTVYI